MHVGEIGRMSMRDAFIKEGIKRGTRTAKEMCALRMIEEGFDDTIIMKITGLNTWDIRRIEENEKKKGTFVRI